MASRVLVALAVAFGALLLAGNALAGGPTITSDQADYAPGSTVTLTGAGWGVGETVHVTVDDLLGQTWSWTSNPDPIAGLDGSFSVSLDLPNYFVSDYSVRAVGSSGAAATTAFTDGDVKGATLAIRKSDCTTASTTFNSGDTVCAVSTITSVTGSGNGDIFVQWTKPDGTLATAAQQHTGVVNTSFQDKLAVSVGGTWTVTVCTNSSSPCGANQTLATQTFTVAAPTNNAPAVAANNSSVSTTEGSNATNSGTWSDADAGDTVTLTASVGTVTKAGTNASGTWSWSLGTTDGPAGPTTVTITANDTHTTRTATFTYSVSNVAPTLTAPADQSATINASQSLSLGSFGDPGADSPWSVDVDWGDGSAHGTASLTSTGTIPAQSHTYASAAGSPYTVTVKVTDKDGAAGTSTFRVTVAKLAQSITFAAPTGKTYGDGDFDPGATASSGLAVAYSSSTSSVCTIASGKIHIVGAGLCSVTASQAGNSLYAAATDVTQTFTVAQKGVAITAATGQSKVYGNADPALTFTNDAGLAASAFTGALSRAAGESVGSYAIGLGTLSAGTNYILTLASPASFAITARTLHVAADAQTKVYGDADPTLTYKVTAGDLQFTDTAASVLTGALHRAPGESVAGGPYAIDKGTLAANGNYSLAFTGANLAVTTRPLTVKADAKSKVYGNDDPSLTYKVTSGSLAFADAFGGSLSRAAGENVGTYAITQGTLALNANYDVTYVGADLTITKRAVAVAADPKTKVYGAADPALTYQITSGTLAFHDSFSGSLARAAGESVAGGPYAIGQGTLSLGGNYDLAFVGSVLTVTPHTLRVAAKAQSKVYGEADPALDYDVTAADLQLGDKAGDVLSGGLDREPGQSVGSYAIGVGSLVANANYTLDFTGATLKVTPRTLHVAADDQTKVYGAADPALTFKVTQADLQYSDKAADVLTGALDRAPGQNVGSYAIGKGTLAANGNYTLDFTGATLKVTPHGLRVTADDQSKVYGEADPALTYKVTQSDLQYSDKAGDVLSGTLDRAPGQNVGSYAIGKGSLAANGNYTLDFTGASLAITPHALRVAADDQSKVYGEADPALTYKVTQSDLQYSDKAVDVLSGTLDRAPGQNVGSYAIGKGSLAANGNYTLDFTGATLKVTPHTLHVAADDQTKVYGETDPALTYKVTQSDLQYLDKAGDVLSGTLDRAPGQSVGSYAIGVGSLAANGNYTLDFTGATLKVTPRTLHVAADDQTKVYGEADPALTYKVTQADLQYDDKAGDVLSGGLEREPGQSVRSYAIGKGSLAANGNYTLDFTGATLKVTPHTLRVAADDQTKVYGEADPLLSYKVVQSDLQYDDKAADVLNGTLDRAPGQNVGSYAIGKGSLAANANYTLDFTGATLKVTPHTLRVAAKAQSKVYGEADPELAYDVTAADLQLGDKAGDVLSGTLDREPGQSVGSYAIGVGSLVANGNYTLDFTGATLKVTPHTLRVAAKAQSKVYGEADPGLDYDVTAADLQLGDKAGDVLSGTLDRAPGQDVGSYAIGVGSLVANANYTLDFTGAILKVTPRDLHVAADPKTKVYGADDPALTYTVTTDDLRYGDTGASVLSGLLTRAVGQTVGGSPYAIGKGSLAANGNYTLVFAGSQLEITQRTLHVTADDKSKVYGSADPAFTYQVPKDDLQYSDTAAGVLGGALDRAPGQNAGTYAINKGTLAANANYLLDFTGASLEITAHALHVAADPKTKVYGSNDPDLTYTVTDTDLQHSDKAAGVLSGALNRGAGQSVGDYTIGVGSLVSNDNYALDFKPSKLTITPHDLHVAANPQTKVYGANDPSLTYAVTATDLQYGDKAADVLNGALDRAPGQDVGSYAIGVGSLVANANYTLDFTGATLKVTPRDLHVGADPKTKVYGADDPALTYTVTTDDLQYSDSGPSVLSGSLTRAVGQTVAGSPYAIGKGSLAANGNYTLVFAGSQLEITQRTLHVTADDKSKVYGSADPAFTYQVPKDDLQYSDTAAGVLSGALDRAAGQNAGTYAINKGTLAANANYLLDFTGATLTIAPHDLAVSADPKSKVYGSDDPALTWTVTKSDLQNGDTDSVVSGSLKRAPGNAVGTYAITNDTLVANANYTLHFTGSTLTITPHKLHVAAAPKSKVYGGDDPALTYSVTQTDLQYTDTDAVLTGAISREPGQAVGSYAIKQNTLAANANYDLVFAGSSLTITTRPVTVTADAKTKTYGENDPELTYKVTKGSLAYSDAFDGSLDRAAGQGVGTYAITKGTLALNANYDLTYEGANLTITTRPVTVTADAKTKVYGNADPALTYKVTKGSLAYSDQVGGSLDRAPGQGVGTYAITKGSLALNTNYVLTYEGADLTITTRPVTVTADAKTKVYGNADPALTYQVTSGSLAYNDAFSGALSRAAGESVGTYGIAKGTLGLSGNYDLTYVGANLSITKRPVTITADPQTKILGAADPALTYKVTSGSVVTGDAFSGALSRAAGETIGSYAIGQNTLTLGGNYTLTYVGANLTIIYGWNGFLQPINDTAHQIGATESLFKLGSTVPVKFQLKNASGGLVQAATLPTFTRSANRGACDATTAAEVVVTDPAFTSSAYRWDTTQYIYNFSTKGLTAGEYRIYAVLDDNTGNANWVDICLR